MPTARLRPVDPAGTGVIAAAVQVPLVHIPLLHCDDVVQLHACGLFFVPVHILIGVGVGVGVAVGLGGVAHFPGVKELSVALTPWQ